MSLHPLGAVIVPLALFAACHGTPRTLAEPGSPLQPCPSSPNCVSTEALDTLHAMPAVSFSGTPERAQSIAHAALLSEPRTRITLDLPGYLRAEATSRIFCFVDDVEIVVDATASPFRFRSASRVREGDMGVNRARMQRVSDRLRSAVAVPVPRP
ncbi:MAG: DUF1499 domain-containing protein [Gemmatimonadaceae bacterium]|nr:DUF1499 domain-containing protein [Gemmatimonadaceae bacterium]